MNRRDKKSDGLDLNDVITWSLSRIAEANRHNINSIIDAETLIRVWYLHVLSQKRYGLSQIFVDLSLFPQDDK